MFDYITDTCEICALLGYYAAYTGNSLQTFRNNLSFPPSRVKKSEKKPPHRRVLYVISGFLREVDEISSLLGYHATYIGNFVPTFRDSISGQRSRILEFSDPLRWDQYVVPKFRYGITNTRCVISQKSAHLLYFAAAARNKTTSIYVQLHCFLNNGNRCHSYVALFKYICRYINWTQHNKKLGFHLDPISTIISQNNNSVKKSALFHRN